MGMFLRRGTAPHRRSLADVAEGTLVKLNEEGTPVEFYVACHNYDPGLNGNGKTLLVRKDCCDMRVFSSLNNAYATSDLDEFLNGPYIEILDTAILSAIGTTKFYYTPGNGNTTVTTLQRAAFQLSVTELGERGSYANTEGTALPIASTLRIAYHNGSACVQWTRTPYTYDLRSAYCLFANGSLHYNYYDISYGPRPAFTLPSAIRVSDDMLIA